MLEVNEIDGIVVLSLGNRLKEEELPGKIAEYLALGKEIFILDLSKVQKVDSLGIGLLVSASTEASNRGGRLVLAEVPERVLNLFRITNLNMFPIYSNIAEALKALRPDERHYREDRPQQKV